MRLLLGIPVVATTVSLLLAALALSAGSRPGFLEDYHIILLNTSALGQNLIPTPTTATNPSPASCGLLGGPLGRLCASVTAAVADAVGSGAADLAGVEDDIADKLSEKLGIQQWYSLHVTNICRGTFAPNATTVGAALNVTNCTEPLKTSMSYFLHDDALLTPVALNISALLDNDLELGPFHLNIANLSVTQDLEAELGKIPKLLQLIAALYILAISLTGIALFLSVAAWFLPMHSIVLILSIPITVLAALALLVGNVITSIAIGPVAGKINEFGQHIGLSASTSQIYGVVVWLAFFFLAVAAVFWVLKRVFIF